MLWFDKEVFMHTSIVKRSHLWEFQIFTAANIYFIFPLHRLENVSFLFFIRTKYSNCEVSKEKKLVVMPACQSRRLGARKSISLWYKIQQTLLQKASFEFLCQNTTRRLSCPIFFAASSAFLRIWQATKSSSIFFPVESS